MTILIDECLSEDLVHLARSRGHEDATHVRWIGKGGWKDWNLASVIMEAGYLLVTTNSVDFRGQNHRRGSSGEHARMELHAGLICLNAPHGYMNYDLALEAFEIALDKLAQEPDLYNRAIEIDYDPETEEFRVTKYRIPADGPYSKSDEP